MRQNGFQTNARGRCRHLLAVTAAAVLLWCAHAPGEEMLPEPFSYEPEPDSEWMLPADALPDAEIERTPVIPQETDLENDPAADLAVETLWDEDSFQDSFQDAFQDAGDLWEDPEDAMRSAEDAPAEELVPEEDAMFAEAERTSEDEPAEAGAAEEEVLIEESEENESEENESEEEEPAEAEKGIPEEECFEEGYDPTVTPGGSVANASSFVAGVRKQARLAAAASGAGTIDPFVSFRDQLGTFSEYVYSQMEELYAVRGLTGTSVVKDSSNEPVPALRLEFSYEDALARGLTFPAVPYTGDDGKTHIDTTTEAFRTAYASYTSQIQSAIDAFTYDHPEVYWYRPNGYKAGYAGKSLTEGNEKTWIGYFSSVTLLMREPFEGAYDLREAFAQQVQSLKAQLLETSDYDEDGSVSALEYIQAAHDYVVSRAWYDSSGLSTYAATGDYRIFTAAGLFLDSVGSGVVCEGYSKAMKILLNAQGIACCLIPGVINTTREGHMWNAVCLEGSWYLLDATWDDKGDQPDEEIYYRYYLVGDIAGRTTSAHISDSSKANAQVFAYPMITPVSPHRFEQVQNGRSGCASRSKYACADGEGIAYWLPATSHVLEKTGEVPASCETAGNIAYYTCSACGLLFRDSAGEEALAGLEETVVPALGHRLTETKATAPSCEKAGNIACYTCSTCKKRFLDSSAEKEIPEGQSTVLPALGHALQKTEAKAPTCEEPGTIAYYTCSICKARYLDSKAQQPLTGETQTILPALGHRWDAGRITKYPTVSAKGTKTCICLHDSSHTRTESLRKLTKKEAEGSAKTKNTVAWAEKKITSGSGELPGASAALLRLYSTAQTQTSVTLQWNTVKGADGYILYGALCGSSNRLKRLKKLSGGKAASCTVKKLKKGKYYKFSLAAYRTVNGIETILCSGKLVHIVTKGGTRTNIAKVTASAKTAALKKGSKTSLSATTRLQAAGKKTSLHRALRYESTNPLVASVNAKTGKVTARSRGSCQIYVYAQSGAYARVKITVR